jgi:hypothetical protein
VRAHHIATHGPTAFGAAKAIRAFKIGKFESDNCHSRNFQKFFAKTRSIPDRLGKG